MKKINYPKLNETLYHEVLDNGLNVFMLPKQGFQKTYVTFSTNLGSLSTNIIIKDKQIDLPMGIAHFLEHKLFEQNGKDVSSEFARNQAEVNAYTQHNRTTYLFSCTDNLIANLDILLNFVQNPDFTEEGIKKEIGIITQEIKMYEDDPGSVGYYGVIRSLFEKHPIANEILGTVETINTITKDKLELVHKYFYNPNNMIMFITGNFDQNEIIKHIKASNYIQKPRNVQEKIILCKNKDTYKQESSTTLEVNIPTYLLGIKQPPVDINKENIMKKELIYSILSDMMLGKSSKYFQDLLSKGFVNDSFGMDINFDRSFAYFLVGGETSKPDELKKYLINAFKNIENFEIVEKDFLRTKKQIIGGFIKSLNSLEAIASMFTKYYYYNCSLFDILDIAKTITIKDIEEARITLANEAKYASFTIKPKKNDAI